MLRTYRQLPDIPTGYPLDDVWSVIVPVSRTNLCTNPSFETNTTAWTAIGGSIARSTAQQYHGAYSLAITPTATTTDGARFDTVSLTSGTTYAYSAKVRGVAGLKYKIAIETTGSVELNAVTFTATGRFQWIAGYWTETSTTTRRFTVRKSGHASVAIFYLDGAQVEAIATGELVSTYIDGDQLALVPNQNPPAYYWNGTPHASTSTRSGLTRAGGMVIPFKKYGFILTAMIGLGLALPQNVATEYARLDGGYDDYTRKPSRQFTLAGRFQGRTYAELRRNRSGLSQLLDRDLIGQDQRLTLMRHVEDGYGRVLSSAVRVLAKYQGGLDGNTDNMAAQSVPITFTQYLPVVLSDGEAGAALGVSLSVTNANSIVQRSAAGVWSALGTGATGGEVKALAIGLDGKIYAGGLFTDMGGVANTNHIAYWDGSAWNAMGTGITGTEVDAFAIGPDGSVYAGGFFTLAGGVANTVNIAKWNGSAWSALGTGANDGVESLVFGLDGTLYAGGRFTLMGGVANTVRIAKWNGTVWSALSTGASNNDVLALAIGPDGSLYAGGDYTLMAGVANTANIAKWNGTVWSALSTGTNGSVRALVSGLNGLIYAAGGFTTAGGVSALHVAQWNGVAWQPMGSGVTCSSLFALATAPGSLIYAGGDALTRGGGVDVPDGLVTWNGAAWTYTDIDLPGTADVNAISIGISGTIVIGFNTTGSATVAGGTTVTNPGTAKSYPIITINGPSSGTARIYSIINYTTNRAIYLNLTLNTGETATLVLQPDNLSFISDFQGNIASTILPGSNPADFFLQPGANTISFFSASSTVVATLHYRPAFVSLDDVP